MCCDAVRYDAGALGAVDLTLESEWAREGQNQLLDDVIMLVKMRHGDGETADSRNR